MNGQAKSFLGRLGRRGCGQFARQRAVLLPVVVVAALSGWTLGSPQSTKGQSAKDVAPAAAAAQETAPANAAAAALAGTEANPAAPVKAAAAAEAPPVNGLKISSQSWRRGGLGSKALMTFTLRNDNDYAVKDIEIVCAFSRTDGSHLTDRKRVLPELVNMKSRRTFERLHIGFVNLYANKAKCTPIAASRA